MSRYLPAKVRLIATNRGDGSKEHVYVIICPEHGFVTRRETHNGAHMAKAQHNRQPHAVSAPNKVAA